MTRRRKEWLDGRKLTDAHNVAVPIMQRLNVPVLVPAHAHESEPELGELAAKRARVACERVERREAVDTDRENERGEVGSKGELERRE